MQTLIEAMFHKCTLASPDRILVATDLNDLEFLMPHILAQAISSSARVTLLHAVIPPDSLSTESTAAQYMDASKINRDIRLILLGFAREIEGHGVACDIAVRNGYAARVIGEEIELTGATRLILGTHGRGRLGQLVLGSVAQEMIASAKIPVFVVGVHARNQLPHAIPRKILHPVSLMGNYRESVDLALDIAQNCRAELTLLHVFDESLAESVNPERAMQWAGNVLEALKPGSESLTPPVHTMVRTGKLAEEILKAADEKGSDLIVLGINGGHRLQAFFSGTASRVLSRATCPVLTIRHENVRVEEKLQDKVAYTYRS